MEEYLKELEGTMIARSTPYFAKFLKLSDVRNSNNEKGGGLEMGKKAWRILRSWA